MPSVFSVLASSMTVATLASAHNFRRSEPQMPAQPASAAYNSNFCWGLYPVGGPCPIKNGTFDQYIDHSNPSLGTFKQRYWVNDEHYAGPGAPIILHGPNESAADRGIWYSTNMTADGYLAQEVKGAAIVIEHRYYGDSSPYNNLNSETLQYLTLDQSLRDLVNFAKNVKLHFAKDNGTHPDNAPWVYSGGSYPGALATWLQKLYPGTFWAYHATSAVVQPIAEYWQYYTPIEAAMPKNCSTDFKAAMRLLETKLKNAPNDKAKNDIKAKFGLAGLEDDDFGWAVIDGLQKWQGHAFTNTYATTPLYQMCDYMEGVPNNNAAGGPVPGEEGVGACKALKGLATWLKKVQMPGSCKNQYWSDPNSIACWDLHNTSSPLFTDRTPRNKWNTQWQWFSCNEPFQQWQASAPGVDTGLIPSFLTMKDLRDQCDRFFPDVNGKTFGLKNGRTTEDIVKLTGGWDYINTTRLVYVNGEYDPWIQETVSSPRRPGGPLQSTPEVPVYVVPKAAHCPDMVMANIWANEANTEIFHKVFKTLTTWIGEFYTEKGIAQPGSS
ncbi:hypothetical protein VHEMI02426 [[Torrubiella] hemipterigena]|uniref:Serine peptidase n=1 Tax=[Torrubiella] hemipterigena TaxID=1531966 RepID=A0A0A1SVP5_9HYPO|nr:hypothetical protein VHEMI02426 [[Torrubiella] hemipterigena]